MHILRKRLYYLQSASKPMYNFSILGRVFKKTSVALLSGCFIALSLFAEVDQPPKIVNDESVTPRDILIMSGLYGIQTQDADLTKYSFYNLYMLDNSSEYLIELVRILDEEGRRQDSILLLEQHIAKYPNDINAKKVLVTELFTVRDITKASELAAQIANETKDAKDEEMAGDLYLASNNPNLALKYYKLAYEKTKSDKILDKLASIMYSNFNQKGEAIALYETHAKMYGCTKYLCERLAAKYQEQNNVTGIIDVYKRLYFKTKDENYFRKVVELSAAIGDINGLVNFLKTAKADDKLLLEAYKYQKDYKLAIPMAKKIWLKTKDIKYLADYAMLRIDEYPDGKAPLNIVKESVADLRQVVKTDKNDIYENFLGYLLIDYNLGLNEGITFVKSALEKDPTSPFYADSLAWGLYKQNKCAEALPWMNKAADKLSSDPIVVMHLETIKKCAGSK
ncbi:MAG: hypothetical protein RL154_945 [Pseudomonadota bacterium]